MIIKLFKFYFTLLSAISPKTSAKSAFLVFQKVRKKDIRDREKGFFTEAKKQKLTFTKEDLDVFEFGTEKT